MIESSCIASDIIYMLTVPKNIIYTSLSFEFSMSTSITYWVSLLRCLTTISNLIFNQILLKSMYVQCVLVVFVTPWTVSCQAPLSMEFSRQDTPSFSRGSSQPRDWTHVSCTFLSLQVDSLPLRPPGGTFSIEHMITPNLLLHSFSIYIVTWLKNLKIILDFFPLWICI